MCDIGRNYLQSVMALNIASPFTGTPAPLKRDNTFARGQPFSVSRGRPGPTNGGSFSELPYPVDSSSDNASNYGSGSTDSNGSCNYTYALDTSLKASAFNECGPWESIVMKRVPTDVGQCAFHGMSVSIFNLKMAGEDWRKRYGSKNHGDELLLEFDMGRIVQHTHVEDWQKNGEAQFITTHIYKRAPIFNYWATCYGTMFRNDGEFRLPAPNTSAHGSEAVVNEGDRLWWILKRFKWKPVVPAVVPAGTEHFWQLVPFVQSWSGAPSPLYYCDSESEGAAIYVGVVLETNVNDYEEREDIETVRKAVFPRDNNYKTHLLKLSKLVVFLGI